MASIFPLEAANIAFKNDISLVIAARNATSEEKGTIVAAKKAEKKSATSAMKYFPQLRL